MQAGPDERQAKGSTIIKSQHETDRETTGNQVNELAGRKRKDRKEGFNGFETLSQRLSEMIIKGFSEKNEKRFRFPT